MQIPDRSQFLRACDHVLSITRTHEGIGLLSEKCLHAVLKTWVEPGYDRHEQKILPQDGGKGYVIADVLTERGEIFEIQTGGLYALRRKLDFYKERTAYPVTVIHPIIREKTIHWKDPESGAIRAHRRSPKKENIFSVLGEIKPFVSHIVCGRFCFCFPSIRAEEVRLCDGWGNRGKRGSHRYERYPTDLLEVCLIRSGEDLRALFPQSIPAEFTAYEFARYTGIGRGYALYDALAVFVAFGVIAPIGKRGRAVLYRRRDQ